MFPLPSGVYPEDGFESLEAQKTWFRAKTDLNDLELVLSWFAQLYQPFLPQVFWSQCQLALAEGFTNAIRHAHKAQPPDAPIDVEVTLTPKKVEIRIWDSGPPFNLEQHLSKLPEKVDESAVGGRGVKLMQDIADHLSYQRTTDNRNCLLIVKYYTGESGFSHSKMTRLN